MGYPKCDHEDTDQTVRLRECTGRSESSLGANRAKVLFLILGHS